MAGSKHYSDLTAVKSAFISALLWANTVGNMNKTQAKKKQKTGHNQMRWLVTWVNAFLHVFLIHWQKEKRQKKNTTNDGDCCTKCAPGLKPVLEYWTQTNKLVFFFIWACLYTESVWTEITISNHCFIIIIIIVMVSLPFNSEENVNKWQLNFTF